MACKNCEERRQYLKGIYDEGTERLKSAIARLAGKADQQPESNDVEADGAEQSTTATKQSVDSNKQRTKRTNSSTD